jgi:hypothetical protein
MREGASASGTMAVMILSQGMLPAARWPHVPGGNQAGGQHMQVRAADAAAGDVDEHLSKRRCRALDVGDAHLPAGAGNGRSHS